MSRSEVTAVYEVDPANRVSLRQVRVGHRLGDRIEVLAGLCRPVTASPPTRWPRWRT